jgi:hypothetical protein
MIGVATENLKNKADQHRNGMNSICLTCYGTVFYDNK